MTLIESGWETSLYRKTLGRTLDDLRPGWEEEDRNERHPPAGKRASHTHSARCQHPRKKQPHTFADGVIIEYCPDCSRFANHRRHVLNPSGIPDSAEKLFQRLRVNGYAIKYVRIGTDHNDRPCYEHRISKHRGQWASAPLSLIVQASMDDNLDALIASAIEAAKPIRRAKQPPDGWRDVPKMSAVLTRHANLNWRTNANTVPCFDERGNFAGRLTLKDAETELERDGISGEYDDHGELIRCLPARLYPMATASGTGELCKLYARLGIDSFWQFRTFETTYPDVRWNPNGEMKARRCLLQHLSVNGNPVPLRRVGDNL